VLSTTAISGSVRFQSGPEQLLDYASLYLIGHIELTCQNLSEPVRVLRLARRLWGAHATVSDQFNLGRHLVSAGHCRDIRVSAFSDLGRAVA
jgi:hypothetical protein